jgi:hypothetical protein
MQVFLSKKMIIIRYANFHKTMSIIDLTSNQIFFICPLSDSFVQIRTKIFDAFYFFVFCSS